MMKLAWLIGAYALGMAGANLLLKLAALQTGWKAWVFFGAANVTGFTCVVVMPFALKLAPAHVVYAWALGLGFCLLQVMTAVCFKEGINGWQWAGMGCVALGLVLMQIR